MIRKRNGKDITDEEFLNIILPFENLLEEYFIKNIVYEFVAFYLAKGYEMSALWECPIQHQINSAIETLAGIRIKDKFDNNKLNKILKDKYSIKIIDTNTSQMIKI
jgi:hypothetical protein